MPLPNRFQTRVSPEPARPSSGYSIFGLLIAVLLAASMLWYVQNLLIPYQRADAAAHGRPRGNLSDLYPRWLGAREFLLHIAIPTAQKSHAKLRLGITAARLIQAGWRIHAISKDLRIPCTSFFFLLLPCTCRFRRCRKASAGCWLV